MTGGWSGFPDGGGWTDEVVMVVSITLKTIVWGAEFCATSGAAARRSNPKSDFIEGAS
jgi:hypothetical protein